MTYDDIDRWCAGSCMQGARRRARDYDTAIAAYRAAYDQWLAGALDEIPTMPEAPHLGIVVLGDPVYCQACTYGVKAKLSRLDGMACIYAREADGMRGASSEARVSGSSDKASLSPTVEDLDELDGWLRDWKAVYLGADSISRQGGLTDSLTLGCAWLVARVERIMARPSIAADFGREVNAWHARLARFDFADVVVHRKPLRCPSCAGLTLEWKQGDDKVTCRMRDCGRILLITEYDALVEEAVKPARRPTRSGTLAAS